MFNLEDTIPTRGTEEEPIVVNEEEDETNINLYGSSDDRDTDISIDVFPKYHPDPIEPKDLNANCNLILLPTREDILSLLNLFSPTGENIDLVLSNAFHSPIKLKEEMYNIAKEWFVRNPENNIQILDQHFMQYEIVKSNTWIFNLLNHLPPTIKNQIIDKYFNNTVDTSQEIDIHDPITLFDVQQKQYMNSLQGVRVGEFITDLRRCMAEIETIQNIFVIKVADPKFRCCKLVIEKASTIQNKLKGINLGIIMDGKKKIMINGLSVYNCGSNSNFIKYKQISFLSDKVGTFNFFKHFDINPIPVSLFDMETIKPFIRHVYEIICNKNADLYNYLMK